MAVVTRSCGVLPCTGNGGRARTPQNGWTITSTYDFIKTQTCTFAISLSLFHSVRLPREAFKYGAVPYLVVYSFWLLAAGLPITLLQLAVGQLSQQDAIGVWRAVPILRGVGHLKVLTSYLCCVYQMMLVALSTAYLLWIAKGTFPLRDCTKLHITPRGYENKMNASQCFNATFLAPFTDHPQYLGVMAVLIFVLWFFVPIFLYRQRKSMKNTFMVLSPIVVIIAIVLCTFLSDSEVLSSMLNSCEEWMPIYQPYIWQSALVQSLLCTHTVGGYLISAGGTVYRQSDVRWTSIFIIITSLISGWLWVFMWQSIGGDSNKDTSFVAILVLIYQSSISEKRTKEWPILAFGIVLISGIITVLTLLFPVYDKLHRQTSDNWRLFATASSVLGTIFTVAVLSRGLHVASVLDDLVVPVLAVFTTAVEVVGFVFIYGWCYLVVDIEFLTGSKLPCVWAAIWWSTPFLLLGITGWWLRVLLRDTLSQTQTLWPLGGVLTAILVMMVIMAAVAVAKEEQFNLFSKIISSFKPSRLWGPEEPVVRYMWMSQRYSSETKSDENEGSSETNYPQTITSKVNEKPYNNNDWKKTEEPYQRTYNIYAKPGQFSIINSLSKHVGPTYATYTVPRKKKGNAEEKFRSPNICIAKDEIGGGLSCNCNRHFTLNVPVLRSNETTTSL